MRHLSHAAALAISVEAGPTEILTESLLSRNAGRPRCIEGTNIFCFGLHDVPTMQGIAEAGTVHCWAVQVEQVSPSELSEDSHDPTGAVHVFHMVERCARCDLAQLRNFTRQRVDRGHVEVHPGLLRSSEQVQDRVGRTTHRDIKAHGVFKRASAGNLTRQRRGVILLVPAPRQLDDQTSRAQKQLFPVRVGRQQRAVAGQTQPQSLGQAIHGVGGEHARAGATGWTSRALIGLYRSVVGAGVCGDHHGIDQIQLVLGQCGFARFHRTTRDENHRDIEPHGGV